MYSLIGDKIGRWSVAAIATRNRHNQIRYKAVCDCGIVKYVERHSLLSGRSKSCGCLQRERVTISSTKHGDSRTRLYHIWQKMKDRCYNTNTREFSYYGGKGVTVDSRWLSYPSFKRDMHLSYIIHCMIFGEKDTTLDRIDGDGSYTRSNCRWATRKEQRANCLRSRPFLMTDSNGKKTLLVSQKEAAIDYNLNVTCINACLHNRQKEHAGYTFTFIE